MQDLHQREGESANLYLARIIFGDAAVDAYHEALANPMEPENCPLCGGPGPDCDCWQDPIRSPRA